MLKTCMEDDANRTLKSNFFFQIMYEIKTTFSQSTPATAEAGGVTAGSEFTRRYTLSREWSQTNTEQYSASQDFTLDFTVAPGTKVLFKQLTGNYGPFQVRSVHYLIECEVLSTGKPCAVPPVE